VINVCEGRHGVRSVRSVGCGRGVYARRGFLHCWPLQRICCLALLPMLLLLPSVAYLQAVCTGGAQRHGSAVLR
jgi:hypothetical protein